MYTLPVYALNFEILKYSVAPETNFKSILVCVCGRGEGGGTNSTFVGYTLLLSPSVETTIFRRGDIQGHVVLTLDY